MMELSDSPSTTQNRFSFLFAWQTTLPVGQCLFNTATITTGVWVVWLRIKLRFCSRISIMPIVQYQPGM
uniref:Uncharacterized protein n=1 Tax=Anguilla anguilla TaxID=7936 RepID=A0A0E9UT02_ANGAN